MSQNLLTGTEILRENKRKNEICKTIQEMDIKKEEMCAKNFTDIFVYYINTSVVTSYYIQAS